MLSIVFFGISVFAAKPKLLERKEILESGLKNWQVNGTGLTLRDGKLATRIISKSIKKGIYILPDTN